MDDYPGWWWTIKFTFWSSLMGTISHILWLKIRMLLKKDRTNEKSI